MSRRAWLGATLGVLLVGAGGAWVWMNKRGQAAADAPPKPVASAVASKPPLEIPADEIITVQRGPLAQAIGVTGSVRAVNSAVVKARVAAELSRLNVREGDRVSAGQVLGEQDATELDLRIRQADQQAQAARAQWEITQRTLANNRALVAQGFISPTALESAVSSEAAAQATLQASLAGLEIARKARSDARLVAPLSGTVSQRFAQPGERLGVDARILEIVNLAQMEVEVALAPEDASRVRVGLTATLSAEGVPQPLTARVARINPSAQAGSRTVAVYLALPAHPALRHGVFAKGEILLDQVPALWVPASAVRLDRSRPYLLVLDGELVRERNVTLGGRGRSVQQMEAQALQDGVAEGTRVLAGTLGAVADGTRWKPAR